MKTPLPIEQRIGITECADPGLDFSWENKLNEVAFAVIITKQLNDKLITKLIEHRDKVILHMTCTGFGGSVIEPGVPRPKDTFNQLFKLIKEGFPVQQVIFRLDPVVPTDKGIGTAVLMLRSLKVLNIALDKNDLGKITRVRYSFLDMYKHVEERFEERKIPLPYGKGVFTATKEMMDNFSKATIEFEDDFSFESCAEYNKDRVGCVSSRDTELMNNLYGHRVVLVDSANQRKSCQCPSNKVQIIDYKAPFKCASKCAYCYWKS